MRCMLKLRMDTETTTKAITDGTLPKVMQQIMDKVKPEACYFTTENGDRTAFLFFDLADVSDIPIISEPAFTHLGAKVTYQPAMNLEDLQKGLAQLA